MIKKIILITSFAGLLIACKNKENKSTNETDKQNPSVDQVVQVAKIDSTTVPVISFNETEFDFGKIKQGEKVVHIFKFKNTGKSPLLIENASPSCGCTISDYPKQPIAPNESGEIKVEFDSKNKTGVQNKSVTISANTLPALTTVNIKGTVEAEIKK